MIATRPESDLETLYALCQLDEVDSNENPFQTTDHDHEDRPLAKEFPTLAEGEDEL